VVEYLYRIDQIQKELQSHQIQKELIVQIREVEVVQDTAIF
jgi:hypothetical protein